ncbi:unnamed protein product [Ascophyllum nodosum]
MQPLFHERATNISLTFTQNQSSSQKADEHEAFPVLAADAKQPALYCSVLGSVIPGLDPDPPHHSAERDGAFNRASTTTIAPSLFGTDAPSASKPSRSSPTTTPDIPCLGGEQEKGAATRPGSGGGIGEAGGDEDQVTARDAGDGVWPTWTETAKSKHSVEHGPRVLVRGTARCGKSAILWDYCHRAALAGHRVVLVSLPREDAELANLPHSMRTRGRQGEVDELRGWDASALGRMDMKYVQSREDLAWYLASLHRLARGQRPTVIAVDDVDKIIETSATGRDGSSCSRTSTGAGEGNCSVWSAALRIFALLQDAAEFIDNSGAEAYTCASPGDTNSSIFAGADALSARTPPAPTRSTAASTDSVAIPNISAVPPPPQQQQQHKPEVEEQAKPFATPPPSAEACEGAPHERQPAPAPTSVSDSDDRRGRGVREGVDVVGGWRNTGHVNGKARLARGGISSSVGREQEPVRVVATCSTSDRGILSLCGSFVHFVVRVQNTTGPDAFSLRLDRSIVTAYPRPSPCLADTEGKAGGVETMFSTEGPEKTSEKVVEFARSQLDGSFALF